MRRIVKSSLPFPPPRRRGNHFLAPAFLIALCTLPPFALLPAYAAIDAPLAANEGPDTALLAERESIRQELVSLASQSQATERKLDALEMQLETLDESISEKKSALKDRSRQTAAMTDALLHFARVPPEAWLAMPGKVDDGLRTAVTLRIVTTDLSRQSLALRKEIADLSDLEEESARASGTLRDQLSRYARMHTALEKKVSRRQDLESSLRTDLAAHERTMKKLSAKSENLQELLGGLEKAHDEATNPPVPTRKTPKVIASDHPPALRSFTEARGKLLMPVAGRVMHHYGERSSLGSILKGIEISVRPGAEVVSPYDGEIVYCGPFRDYGNLLIIRHEGGYYSLIAGLSEIAAAPGQYVVKGEPLGRTGKVNTSQNADLGPPDGLTKLYVELRKNSKPIDPMPWIGS